MKSCCFAVIGHVDHGKTTLVRALTGMETDRLDEEKRRGLSIVPGFAHRVYPQGTADFIDVPGHEDFIRAMVSGASGAQAALLVVSARDGVASQTLEHLRIVGLLGIRRGIVAVSQSDLLPAEARALRLDEIRAALAGSVLDDAPLVLCSAHSGAGLEALHTEIAQMVARSAPPATPWKPFLAIDRVFTVQGRGVVVTGTLQGASIAEGDRLALQPGNRPVTIRGLHSRGATVTHVAPGARTAANLRGVTAAEVSAGDVLCAAEGLTSATEWDIAISMMPDARPLKHMQQIRVHIGAGAGVAKLRFLDRPGQTLLPGASALARLHFGQPMVAYPGQRAVLRHLSPAQTLGGAVVLDPQAPPLRPRDGTRVAVLRAARDGDLPRVLSALTTAGQGVVDLRECARLARMPTGPLWRRLAPDHVRIDAELILARTAEAALRARLLAALRDFHLQHPLKPCAPGTLPDLRDMPQMVRLHLEAHLVAEGAVRREADGLALAGHDPMDFLTDRHRDRLASIEDAFLDGDVTPPALSEVIGPGDDDLFALLIRAGTLVRLHNIALNQTLVFHARRLEAAAQTLRARFAPAVWFRTGEARVALGTSRKFIVPLLEHFDQSGLTRRVDALRQFRSAANPPHDCV